MSYKRWIVSKLDKEAAGELCEQSGFDPILCLLLTGRGITTATEAVEFLEGDDLVSDPFAFADMDVAAERIQRAIDDGEHVMVYGDYDADGVTATALLYSYLRSRGAHVSYMLPRRDGDGYGLHMSTIDSLAEQAVTLVVTVDNGIAAVEEIAYAATYGMDVVVTDHHQPPEQLPQAVALVNPHRKDCPSEFKELAGVGVAFQLVCALEGDPDWALEQYADLVALGTLADVMPLIADNRVLVRRGLQQIRAQKRVGFRCLCEAAGIAGKPMSATSIAFTLAPRINAAGRMSIADTAVELLLCESEAEGMTLAGEICKLNTERQTTESEILAEVTAAWDVQPHLTAQHVLVVWGEGWHHGVLGILASRLQELYGKPTLVLSVEDGIARGSGRSLPGFSLYEALRACEHCLLGYGGHELAAGVTLESARLEEFRAAINAYAAEQSPTMPVSTLTLDCKLRPSQITPELLSCLSVMEPFGTGNPAPVFGLYGMQLVRIEAVGGGKHLRLTLSRDGSTLTAMRFSTSPEQFGFAVGDTVNLAVTLDKNEYRGTVTVSVIVRDMRHADTEQETLLGDLFRFDSVLRQDVPPTVSVSAPDRHTVAQVYRAIVQGGFSGTLETLRRRTVPSYLQVLLSLQILSEAGLLHWKRQADTLCITPNTVTEKADLTQTATARYLHNREESPWKNC